MSYLYYEICKLYKWEMLRVPVLSAGFKILSLGLVYYWIFNLQSFRLLEFWLVPLIAYTMYFGADNFFLDKRKRVVTELMEKDLINEPNISNIINEIDSSLAKTTKFAQWVCGFVASITLLIGTGIGSAITLYTEKRYELLSSTSEKMRALDDFQRLFGTLLGSTGLQQVSAIIILLILPVTISYILIQGFSFRRRQIRLYLLDCKYELDRKNTYKQCGQNECVEDAANNVRSIEKI